MKKIKLLLACHSTFARYGLRDLLVRDKEFAIVKEATNTEETLHYTQEFKPDIVLLDYQLLIQNGNGIISRINKTTRKFRVVVFDSSLTALQEWLLIEERVAGILTSNCRPLAVREALKSVHAGNVWLRGELEAKILNKMADLPHSGNGNVPLTKREKEVLAFVAMGYKNRAICSKLFISEGTVKTHINNIFKKLSIQGRLQAACYAIKHGLVKQG